MISTRALLRRRGTRHAVRAMAVGALGLLVIDGYAAFHLIGEVHPVTVAAAVARFRREYRPAVAQPPRSATPVATTTGRVAHIPMAARPSPATTSVASAPAAHATAVAAAVVTPTMQVIEPGVYTYNTTGGERVSTLGGISHSYPSTSTVTVTPIPCGVESRWAPLDARYDDYRFCRTGDAVLLQSLVSYHEFDGQVQKKSFVCDPGSYLRPPTATPGATYAGHCAGSGTDIVMAGKVIGVEPVTVGSQPVRALHVQLKETLTGSIQGTRWTDAWFAMADDMVLRFQSRTDAPSAQTTFGPTHYTEQFSIWLQSLTPQR